MDGKVVHVVRAMIVCGMMGGFTSWPGVATLAHAQSVAAGVSSANAKKPIVVTVNADRLELEHVLRSIAKQAGLRLVLPSETIAPTARVTMHVRDVPVEEAFAQALVGTGLRTVIMSGTVIFSKAGRETTVAQGGITGKVVDAKTKLPLRGATVTLDQASIGTTSGDDGTFRFVNVGPGAHTVRVRVLGYIRAMRQVTVVEGQTVSVDVALEQSVNALDQVVVTGTVVATAQREVPNAMTVITAKDIERRGITKIDQLFRGDVPGLFAMNNGSINVLDEVTMFSRGATALSSSSAGVDANTSNTNPIKTYVDGVELADPRYLNQIDPQSIERIEIVAGPQASTIYGSNAINGVMQIFTKRGTSTRPQLTATLLGGWVENNFSSNLTPQHDDAAQVNGVDGHWSYNVGGSWNYLGPWTPGKQTARWSSFGGARVQQGPLTADGTLRLATTKTKVRGNTSQGVTSLQANGWYTPNYTNGHATPEDDAVNGQTLGFTIGLTPVSWWSHELVYGDDRSNWESRQIAWGYGSPGDTVLYLMQNSTERRSLRYATTLQVPLARVARAVFIVGADAWQSINTSLYGSAVALTGTLRSSTTRQPGHNAGGFLQTQVGIWDQLFLTYGLRAEWNPTYGDEAQPNLAPRYGVTYTRDIETPFGSLTAKLRGSYGRSTRPPAVGAKVAVPAASYYGAGIVQEYFTPWFDEFDYILANPELGPEFQRGGEGGLELYFGNRGSLVVTRFNQTIEGLLVQPAVDSVRSHDPANQPPAYSSCDVQGYCYQQQLMNLNGGNIRNQGWELQGTLVLGAFTTRGTYSWTKSRVIGVDPRYRAYFSNWTNFQPGASFTYLPEHTWSSGITYAKGPSMIALNFSGTGMIPSANNKQFATGITSRIRLTANRIKMNTNYARLNSGYVLADLNASHRLSQNIESVLQVQNLGDRYQNDFNVDWSTMGRQTKVGFRVRL